MEVAAEVVVDRGLIEEPHSGEWDAHVGGHVVDDLEAAELVRDVLDERPALLETTCVAGLEVEPGLGERLQRLSGVFGRLQIELPESITRSAAERGGPLYSISVESRDVPMHTVSFTDESQLAPTLNLRFTNYRTIASIEILRGM